VNPARLLIAAAATAAGCVLLAYVSAAQLPYHAQDVARLRLSWSARPERIEVCRALSAEEQARREEHMRQRVDCEGGFATYTLQVAVDGHAIGESLVHGAGLRHDRPLYLLRDYPVLPGQHRVRVTLTRREKTDNDAAAFARTAVPDADTGLFAGRAQREAAERVRRAHAAIPPNLVLDTTIVFTPRRVTLVTFSAERRELELHGDGLRH
jgi:hypothetical protein